MTTHEARAFYSELLDGELAPTEHAAWQQRLGDDAALAQDFARFVGGVAGLRSLAPAPLAETRVAQLLRPFETTPAAAGASRRAWVAVLSAAAALLLSLAWTWSDVSGVSDLSGASDRGDAHELVAEQSPSAPLMQHVAPADFVAAEPRLWPAEGTRAPRPRASSEMRLVKHAAHTELSLHGDVSSIVPQLIELLEDSDPELVELAQGRLELLRDDLGASGQLPSHLARPTDALGRAPPSTPGEDWRAWWQDARPHLPTTPPGGVL